MQDRKRPDQQSRKVTVSTGRAPAANTREGFARMSAAWHALMPHSVLEQIEGQSSGLSASEAAAASRT